MGQSSNSSYKDLRVWQSSIKLAKEVYIFTKSFPKDQQYGLTSQMQRSAVSVASNIAEGCARNSHQEFIYFLGIACGSLAEFTTQLVIANEIGFIKENYFQIIHCECESIEKMLNPSRKASGILKQISIQ